MKLFFMDLEREEEAIREDLAEPASMNLSPEEETSFQQAQVSCFAYLS